LGRGVLRNLIEIDSKAERNWRTAFGTTGFFTSKPAVSVPAAYASRSVRTGSSKSRFPVPATLPSSALNSATIW